MFQLERFFRTSHIRNEEYIWAIARPKYHAACKDEYRPLNWSNTQLTFVCFFHKNIRTLSAGRVLFTRLRADHAFLGQAFAEHLSGAGVCLLGISYLALDACHARAFTMHIRANRPLVNPPQ